MTLKFLVVLSVLSLVAFTKPTKAADSVTVPSALAWAYGIPAKGADLKPVNLAKTFRVPGSQRTYTGAELDGPIAPDWFPDDHPPMPQAVRQRSGQGATACAHCHWTNGMGHKATASIAGLSADYIREQLGAFKSGSRLSSDPHQKNVGLMVSVARKLTLDEAQEAADYFAQLKPVPWVRVVETQMVPRTIRSKYGWTDRDPKGGRVRLGGRIVELSEDEQRMSLEDPHSGLIAYVPPGSIARGQELVEAARMGDFKCATCHGEGLTGSSIAPRLAGQMPSYLARQMWDIKTGARDADALAAMKEILGGISAEQITDIAAYCSSLDPR